MSYNFQREDGKLIENEHNLHEIIRLLLDWGIINHNGGEGTRAGDGGSWHGICHIVAAGVVGQLANGQPAWLEIGWHPIKKRYCPIIVFEDNNEIRVQDIDGKAKEWASRITVRAYVEGNSRGRISNRQAIDPGVPEKNDRRQDYDRFPLDFENEGGKVWEHWCTTRDIKKKDGSGAQVLRAYLALLSVVGTEFAAVILRGRLNYGHPDQLRGCIEAGLITKKDANWLGWPKPIPMDSQILFYYSEPLLSFAACKRLLLKHDQVQYFMFERSIHLFQRQPK